MLFPVKSCSLIEEIFPGKGYSITDILHSHPLPPPKKTELTKIFEELVMHHSPIVQELFTLSYELDKPFPNYEQ